MAKADLIDAKKILHNYWMQDDTFEQLVASTLSIGTVTCGKLWILAAFFQCYVLRLSPELRDSE